MRNNAIFVTEYELIGQLLDGVADDAVRRMVASRMLSPMFEECLLIAERAVRLFDNNSRL